MGLLTKNLKPWHLVIVCTLILIFIVVPLTLYTAMKFTILHRHSKYTKAHNEDVKRFNQAQQRLNIIKEALGGIVFYEHSPKLYAFEADTEDFDYQSISFVSRVPPNFPGSKKFAGQRTRRIQFIVEDGKEGERELVMYQTPLLQPRDEYMLDESHRHIILGQLDTFMCMLWSSTENDWIYHWEDNDTVPTRIKIELAQNKPDGSTAMVEDILAINIPTKIANITQAMQNPTLPAARTPSSRSRNSSRGGDNRASSQPTPEQIAAYRKRMEDARKKQEDERKPLKPVPTRSRYAPEQIAAYRKKMAERSMRTRITGPAALSLPPGMVAGELGMLLYKGNNSRVSTSSRSSVNGGPTGLVSGELGMLLYEGNSSRSNRGSTDSRSSSNRPSSVNSGPTDLVSGELGLLLYRGP